MIVDGLVVGDLIGNVGVKNLLQTGLKIFQGHQQHAEQVAAAMK